MRKVLAKIALKLCIAMLMLVVLFTQSVTYAWLTTAWTGGEFEVTTAYTNTPKFELWTYHKTADKTDATLKAGWYKTYGKDTSDTNSEIATDKEIDRIHLATDSDSTFTPSGEFSLYFGTINNLVQEKENTPVYLKFAIKLIARSTNQVIINCSLAEDSEGNSAYVRPYLVDTTTDVGTLINDSTDNHNLKSALNDTSEYNFLSLHYFFSDTDYSLTDDKGSALPENFESQFTSTENTALATFDLSAGTASATLTNGTTSEVTKYLYLKFSVPTQALQDALLYTDLKTNIPAYLIFDTNFSLEVKSASN